MTKRELAELGVSLLHLSEGLHPTDGERFAFDGTSPSGRAIAAELRRAAVAIESLTFGAWRDVNRAENATAVTLTAISTAITARRREAGS